MEDGFRSMVVVYSAKGVGRICICLKCVSSLTVSVLAHSLFQCRRCNLPIEKQAVSSSDGQLKGKYHKECFNCYTCQVRLLMFFLSLSEFYLQKPFPDKSFYVYDGKPFCAYHYHEKNDSLCAAATCGQPVEGPCAVSHAGDRYHPEHVCLIDSFFTSNDCSLPFIDAM